MTLVSSVHSSIPAPRLIAQDPIEIAIGRLKTIGFRITQPRIAVLQALSRCAHPVTIEQLRKELRPDDYDLMTVYRCVAALVKAGIVHRRGFFHNGTALYKMEIGQRRRYQVVCKATNRVADLDEETCAELRAAIENVERQLRAIGYTKVGHILEFFSVWPDSEFPGSFGRFTESGAIESGSLPAVAAHHFERSLHGLEQGDSEAARSVGA
jgi:Fur family ferric uptake transcriptional regulator